MRFKTKKVIHELEVSEQDVIDLKKAATRYGHIKINQKLALIPDTAGTLIIEEYAELTELAYCMGRVNYNYSLYSRLSELKEGAK